MVFVFPRRLISLFYMTWTLASPAFAVLIPNRTDFPDFPSTSLSTLLTTLSSHGFQPHLTTLGGPGFAVLSSPLPTSQADQKAASDEGAGVGTVVPKRAGLRDAGVDGLEGWAKGLGGWCYA